MVRKYGHGMGWFRDSQRHSLSAKGISTGRKMQCRIHYSKATRDAINKILFSPKNDAVDKEVLIVDLPRSKKEKLEFLKAYTEYPTIGKWHQYKDKNLQVEVQFKDAKDEKYGKRLMRLMNKLNKEEIKEEQIYARTQKIEESTI